MSDKRQVAKGIFFRLELLTIFLLLKVWANVDWSWWIIFSPLWIPFCSSILFSIIYYLTKQLIED